jgi:sugar (pentulose or hexulose) kinase
VNDYLLGIVLALNEGLDLLLELGPVGRIVAAGGATRHPLWLQLQADIFNLPVTATQRQEATAAGAALLAGIGIGYFTDIQKSWESQDSITMMPDQGRNKIYQQIAGQFINLYTKRVVN